MICEKTMSQTHNIPQLKTYRRQLRNNMTAAEVALWIMLRKRQLNGERFLRQHSIGHFIVDFYCPKYKLAIELDGDGHFDEAQAQYDIQRTEYLNSLGVTVIRFENCEVFNYPQRVLDEIATYLK